MATGMTRRPTRRDGIEAKNRKGWRVIGGCVALLAGTGFAFAYWKAPQREMSTRCLASIARLQTLISVDRSDAWSDAHSALLKANLLRSASEVQVDDRLSIISFDGDADKKPVSVFERCNGGDGGDSWGLVTTASRERKAHAESWAKPLEAALVSITESTNSKQSEIVKHLADVVAMARAEGKAKSLRLILYSNLEEHSKQASFYQKKPLLTASAFASFFKETIRDRLNGVSVEIVYVPARSTTPELTRRTKAAWSQALTSVGANFSLRDF